MQKKRKTGKNKRKADNMHETRAKEREKEGEKKEKRKKAGA
jgi:hypothetical protein